MFTETFFFVVQKYPNNIFSVMFSKSVGVNMSMVEDWCALGSVTNKTKQAEVALKLFSQSKARTAMRMWKCLFLTNVRKQFEQTTHTYITF